MKLLIHSKWNKAFTFQKFHCFFIYCKSVTFKETILRIYFSLEFPQITQLLHLISPLIVNANYFEFFFNTFYIFYKNYLLTGLRELAGKLCMFRKILDSCLYNVFIIIFPNLKEKRFNYQDYILQIIFNPLYTKKIFLKRKML